MVNLPQSAVKLSDNQEMAALQRAHDAKLEEEERKVRQKDEELTKL